jgi:ketosteroid isomerase-like protein
MTSNRDPEPVNARQPDPVAADREFFASLIARDMAALDGVLAADFVLIDVVTGSEVPREVFIDLVGSGQLAFDAIDPDGTRVRRYGSAAVVTGRTEMKGRFDGTPFTVNSRYTHVFVEQEGRWRLASAQGTQITPT